MAGKRKLNISKWLIKPGAMVVPGQVAAKIEGVPPDNRTVRIIVPWSGKVSKTSQARPSDDAIPDGHLFIAKNYVVQKASLDPLRELRSAYEDALAFAKAQATPDFDFGDLFADRASCTDRKYEPPKPSAWERVGLVLQFLVVAFSLGVIIYLGVALYHVIARHF